jgi:hypothetical protein
MSTSNVSISPPSDIIIFIIGMVQGIFHNIVNHLFNYTTPIIFQNTFIHGIISGIVFVILHKIYIHTIHTYQPTSALQIGYVWALIVYSGYISKYITDKVLIIYYRKANNIFLIY